MLHFAYGSNMDWNQMRQRCPSARFVSTAKLSKHKLTFPRKSRKRGCGAASIEPEQASGSEVWGVVFQINELDIGQLDKFEGYNPNREVRQNAYVRKEIRVERDGDALQSLTVWTYVANVQPGSYKPSREYKETILQGATFWHLPDDYLRKLQAIETE